MKETKAKKSTYLRNFIIAVTLSAAILAAGALWVLLGWRSALDVTLTDLAGDPAALRGFTMRGQSYFDTAHTYWDLHDGYLDTSFALDPDESDDRYHYSAWGASHSTFYAVTPETRDEVNAAAQRVQVYDDNWQMQSTASHFRVMAEISMGSDVLRVALRDVVLDAPISVSANAEVPTYLDRTSVSYDYTADFSDEVEDTNTDYRYIAGQIFSLGDGQGLAWRYTVADRKAGLYKATPISYDDLAALPADGKVGDRDVLCATTEFGTLEPFYCPENARQVVCGLPMDDGLTLCVYLDPLNKACADLVNAAGEQVDHIELGIEGDNGDFSVTALPRTTDRDAVLKVDFRNLFVALRVQDGKFSLHQTLSAEGGSDQQAVDIYLRNAEDAVPGEAKDKLFNVAAEIKNTFHEFGAPLPPLLEGCTVVDLCCGSGRDSYLAAQLVGPAGKVVGVEPNAERLAIAQKYLDKEMKQFGYGQPNVELVRGVPEEEIKERVYATLKICGLYQFRNWPVSALSFGQKKRVTIASILVLHPQVLILDEPTAGQDYRHYTEIMEFLKKLNEEYGITIIMITHDMHLMLEYTNRAVVIADGRLLADTAPAAVLTDDAVADRAYLKKTSLYDLAVRCGIAEPTQFVERFIGYERQMRAAEREEEA